MWCRLMSIYIPILPNDQVNNKMINFCFLLMMSRNQIGGGKAHIFRVADGSVAVIPAISFVNFT